MKKLFMLATAAFLFTGAAFAHDGKECEKGKGCCKKEGTAKKECCKKGEKAKDKEAKTLKPAVVKA